MEPGAPTRQSDHDPTHGQKDHDRNYKAVVQARTCHPDEKSRSVTNVVVYPRSGHRFDADPAAAADAWQRTLNWFDAHLR